MKVESTVGYVCKNCHNRIVLEDGEVPIDGEFKGRCYGGVFEAYKDLRCPSCDSVDTFCMVLDAKIINIVPAKGKFKIYGDPTIAPYAYLAVVDEYVDNVKVGHTFTREDIPLPWALSKGQRRKISNRLKLMSTRGVLSIVGKKRDLILFEKVKP